MLPEEVVQLIAAGCRFGEQVLVIQLVQVAAGGLQGGAAQRGGAVGAETGARDQAEPANSNRGASVRSW